MSDAPKIVVPEFSDALLEALERTLKSHDLRLRPGQSLADVATAMKTNQVTLEAAFGGLTATMDGRPVHVSQVIEGLATTGAPDKFFPRDVSAVRSKAEMDVKGRVKFINEHGGAAFEALPATAPTAPVVLDKSKLSAAEYKALPRSTKVELLNHWSPEDVSRILNRK